MSYTPSLTRAGWRRRGLVGTVVAALAATGASFAMVQPAQGAITAPSDGTVIRDAGPITITEDRGGQYANLAAATTLNSSILGRGCNGTGPDRKKADATIKVIRLSDGEVMVEEFHQTSNNLLSVSSANATGAFSATWDTTGAQPGLYRIISTANDRAKIGNATSQTCTPDTNTVLSDITVEFRPWQHSNFNDLLGHGKVRMNTNPREVQFTVDGSSSAVLEATPAEMQYFGGSLPALPADPSVCATDPSACIPADATACEPSAGCTPRLVYINKQQGGDSLTGIFDLETGAFAAYATTGGKSRALVSAGTELDAVVSDLIAQAAAQGEAFTGLDLLALLSTNVELRSLLDDGTIQTVEVGALHGLSISRALAPTDAVNGLSLKAPYTVNAGFIFFSRTAGLLPAGTVIEPFTVKASPLVPNLPTLFSTSLGSLGSLDLLAPVPVPAPVSDITGPLLLVGGGPLVNIYGNFGDGRGTYTRGTGGLNGPNVDTGANAPSGLPAWLPGVDSGTATVNGPIDFVGHAALFLELSPIDLGALGVIDLGAYLIGQGVTVFGDSPLPALGTLPLLWDTENPAAAALNEYTGSLLTNPAVLSVVVAALGLLGGGTPDLETVTSLLSDADSFASLIESVTGPAGIGEVPGLEDALNAAGIVTELVELPSSDNPLDGILNPLLAALGLA